LAGDRLQLPNLIIAGVGKSGTTSLFHYLAQHPDICRSVVKESDYFSPLIYGHPVQPLAEYARSFAHCGCEQYRLEATPAYCDGGKAVITAIQATLPDVRVIINLRDPAERLWESFWYMKSKRLLDEALTFEQYLETSERLHAEGIDTREENRYHRLSRGFYSEYLGDWMEAFGDRLKIVFFERLVTEPRSVVEELCKWLGIDPIPASSFHYGHHNPTYEHRSRRLKSLAFAVRGAGDQLFRRHPAVKAGLRALYLNVNGRAQHKPLTPQVRQRLQQIFQPYEEPLATLLVGRGFALPSWLAAPGKARAAR
jgi:hypothetical protein